MQSWKFNHTIKWVGTEAIVKGLGITYSEVYRTLRDVNVMQGTIETKDGKKYKLVLEEI